MKLVKRNENLLGILIVISLILISSQKYYFNGENLGYWYFAKQFIYNFDFVIKDRSPLYTVYISPLILLDYPYNLYTEYLVNRSILFLSFFLFFKEYLNNKLIFLIFITWIPFFNVVIPEPQIIALSLLNIAFFIRYKRNNNLAFYLILFVAYLVRQVFIIPLILFILFDTAFVIKEKFERINLKKIFVFMFFCVSILITISYNQSKSTYNNFNFIDTKYLPTSFKSSLNGGFIQTYLHNYYDDGFSKSKNRELINIKKADFPNSNNFLQYITAKPYFFLYHLKDNIVDLSEVYSRAFKNNLKENNTNLFLFLLVIATLILQRKKISTKNFHLKDYKYLLSGVIFSTLLFMITYFSISYLFFFLFICIYQSYKYSLSLFLYSISIILMDISTILSQPQERYLFGMMGLVTVIIIYLIYEIKKFTRSKYILSILIISSILIFSPTQKYISDSDSPHTWLEFILKNKNNDFYGDNKNILTTVLKENCSKILARNGHFFNSFYGYDIKNVIFVSSINPNLNNFVDSDILINEVNCIYNPNELKNSSNLAIQNFVDKKIKEDYKKFRVYNGELIIIK